MAEFTPQDATRPLSGDTPKGRTFDDMPEGNKTSPFGAGVSPIEFADDAPASEPEAEPAERAPAKPVEQTQPAPVPNVAQELAAALYHNEQTRKQQERYEAQQVDYNRRMEQELTPPAIPENLEEVMADPAKMRQLLLEQNDYIRRATMTAVAPAASVVQNLQQEVAQSRAALNGIYQQRKDQAWREARETLIDAGIENPDAYYGHLEQALRANPNDYWNLSMNPEAIVKGVGIIHQDMTGKTIATTRPFRSGRGANRPNAGRSAGSANLNAGAQAAMSKVESVLGVKFSDADRRDFQERIAR